MTEDVNLEISINDIQQASPCVETENEESVILESKNKELLK